MSKKMWIHPRFSRTLLKPAFKGIKITSAFPAQHPPHPRGIHPGFVNSLCSLYLKARRSYKYFVDYFLSVAALCSSFSCYCYIFLFSLGP